MIVTCASFKGGVGKSTTAIHLAAYLQRKAPTLLVDGDPNQSVTAWARRGGDSLSFKVIGERLIAKYAKDYQNIVIDTKARPDPQDLRDLVDNCDLLILPATPDAFSLDALTQTIDALEQIGSESYRVLLTICPPRPSHDAEQAREWLKARKVPAFKGQIRRFSAFQKAALAGVPVYEISDPRAADAWGDYEAIGKELLKGWA
jgi:chromosome partitioning protein